MILMSTPAKPRARAKAKRTRIEETTTYYFSSGYAKLPSAAKKRYFPFNVPGGQACVQICGKCSKFFATLHGLRPSGKCHVCEHKVRRKCKHSNTITENVYVPMIEKNYELTICVSCGKPLRQRELVKYREYEDSEEY